jgi:alpha-glucosidase
MWAVASILLAAATSWSVESPSGELGFVVRLERPAGSLFYAVRRADAVVVQFSPLGLRLSDRSFERGLRLVSAGPPTTVDESYTARHGKRRAVRHQARERAFTFENSVGARLELIARAANDGVAFRYRLPGSGSATLVDEATGFQVGPGSRAWMQPHQPPGKYTPAYEDYFREVQSGTDAPTPSGWSFPALFELEGGRHWLLVSEAGVDATHCGSRLAADASGGRYRIRLPEAGEGKGVGATEPTSALPWTLPWRVLIIGGNLARVVESTLVEDLSPPSAVEDTSWIRPGRASWSWWSASSSPRDEAALKSFIDLASEMGWEYSLVDANWNEMPEGTIQRLVAYGRDKGVGLLLWYNSGGPHNEVTEAPRDRMHVRETRRAEMARLRDWGVKGVKVDFWHSDKQDRIAQYLDILRDAAEYRLLVNFHGCTVPRGWSRTYPHLLSMEAVMGAEQYKFKADYPQKAPAHNTLLVFTRNVVGPMDYTPVTFTDHKYPRLTTDAHELALAVVFESGIQHFADSVEAYRALPAPARDLLKAVPAAWDDTRLLAGDPGRTAVLARRSGTTWFVGGINGEDAARKLDLDLSFLGEGRFTIDLIADGEEPRSLEHSSRRVSGGNGLDLLGVRMPPRGGFVARIAPAPR